MPPLQHILDPSWALESFGYSFDGFHVYEDGRMEGALYEPQYYLYSPPRLNTWEEGLQALGNFDWSRAQERDDMGTAYEKDCAPQQGSQLGSLAHTTTNTQTSGCIEEQQNALAQDHNVSAYATSHVRNVIPTVNKFSPPSIASQLETQVMDTTKATTPVTVRTSVPLKEPEDAEDAFMNKSESFELVKEPASELLAELTEGVDVAMVDAKAEVRIQPSWAMPVPIPVAREDLPFRGLTPHSAREASATLMQPNTLADQEILNDRNVETRTCSQHIPHVEDTTDAAKPLDSSISDAFGVISDSITLLDLPCKVLSPESNASPEPRSPSTQPSNTDGQLQVNIHRAQWDAQLQEAAAEGATGDIPQLHPPVHHEREETVGSQIAATEPLEPGQCLSSLEDGIGSLATQVDVLSEERAQAATTCKRMKPAQTKDTSDIEAEAPAKKRQKKAKITVKAARYGEGSEAREATPARISMARSKRRLARKSVKESSKDIADDIEDAEGSVSKPAEIYFEEQTRPSGDRPAELNREEDDVEQSMNAYDYDIHEHDSDVQVTPTISATTNFHRLPKNYVSSRELEHLGSTLTPGMHLGLHLQQHHTPSRILRPAQLPIKNSTADNMVVLVKDEPLGQEAGSTTSKKKKVATASGRKAPVSSRTKASTSKMEPQPRAGRSQRSKAQSESEATSESGQDLFPPPMLDAGGGLSIAGAPHTIMPAKIVSRHAKASTKGKTTAATADKHSSPHDLGYGKRHTRGDTKYEESRSGSASVAPSINAQDEEAHIDEPAPQPHTNPDEAADEDYSESSTSGRKPKKSKKRAHSSLLKRATTTSRTSTPAPPLLPQTSTSPPVKNKFGFVAMPRTTRSAAPHKIIAARETIDAKQESTLSALQKNILPSPSPTTAKTHERRSTRRASTIAQDAESSAAGRTSKIETEPASETKDVLESAGGAGVLGERRVTRRASAIWDAERERREREGNIGRRLRSGD